MHVCLWSRAEPIEGHTWATALDALCDGELPEQMVVSKLSKHGTRSMHTTRPEGNLLLLNLRPLGVQVSSFLQLPGCTRLDRPGTSILRVAGETCNQLGIMCAQSSD